MFEARRRPRGIRWLYVATIGILFFLLAPIAVIATVSFTSGEFLTFPPPGFSLRWYRELIEDGSFLQSGWLSLQIAVASACLSLIVGTLAALAFRRKRAWHGRLRVLFLAPLIVPYVVLAFGLFRVMSPLGLRGSVLSVILSHSVVTLPFVVVMVGAGLAGLPGNIEDAATGLGASSWAVLRRVTFPLVMPSLFGATIVAFIVSWDEFILSLLLSTPRMQTLPVLIFGRLRDRIDPAVAPLSVLLIMVNVLAVIALASIRKRVRAVRTVKQPYDAADPQTTARVL